jgi:hypothetical protein
MGREGGHELYQSISFDFAYYSTGFLSSVKRLCPFTQQKMILGRLTTLNVSWLNLVTYAAKNSISCGSLEYFHQARPNQQKLCESFNG